MDINKKIALLEKLTGKKVTLEEAHDHEDCHCGNSCCTDKQPIKEAEKSKDTPKA